MRRIWAACWFGLSYTVVSLALAVLYTRIAGRLFGQWGWVDIALALQVLGIMALAGVVAGTRQPNPYSRTDPLYNLRDVPPNKDLDSGGAGWLLQIVPMALALAALLLIARFVAIGVVLTIAILVALGVLLATSRD